MIGLPFILLLVLIALAPDWVVDVWAFVVAMFLFAMVSGAVKFINVSSRKPGGGGGGGGGGPIA